MGARSKAAAKSATHDRGSVPIDTASHVGHLEERYRLIVRASRDVLWDWDLAENRLEWGDGLQTLLRLGEAAIGDTPEWWTNVVHPDDRERFQADARAVIFSHAEIWCGECRLLRGDGTVACTVVRGAVARNRNDVAYRIAGSISDVTERRELEARLLLADRQASIGLLAAGVAHEMRNFITIVDSNLEYTLGEIAGGRPISTEVIDSLTDARQAADRGCRMMRDLQLFGREQRIENGRIDVLSVIESALSLARYELRRRARLVRDFGEIPAVMGNGSRLAQVILNLALNAAQAIPEGEAQDHVISVATRTGAGGQVEIEVSDTGSGVPEEIRAQVFDPFFTTKPVGVGSGLGLSISRSIVEAMGGRITLSAREPRGTVVRVVLPAATLSSGAIP